MSKDVRTFSMQLARARVAILAVLVTASVGTPMACPAQVKVALSSTADSERSGSYVWADAFAGELRQAGMEVIIYPSSTLGNEIVRTEQLLLGLLEVNVTGNQEVEMFSELYRGLELPFLFESMEELNALVDGTDFLERVNATTLPFGMRVVDFAPLGGMTGLFTANTPVHRLEDLALLRLRGMTAQQLEYFAAWGSAGTQVAWEEVPQALQTGIADGYLNPPIVAVQFGHGAQLDFFTDLRLQGSMRTIVMSEQWYQGLEDGKQRAVDRAVNQARRVVREWYTAAQSTEFQMLQDVGIEVITLSASERERFRERLLPLYQTTVSSQVLHQIMELLNLVREDP